MKKTLIITTLIIALSSTAYAFCRTDQGIAAFNACMERERQQQQMQRIQEQQLEMQRQQLQNQQQMIRNQQRQIQQQNNGVFAPQPNFPDPTGWTRPSFGTW